MTPVPSRYDFRSDLEFEQAMNEWAAENEPTYIVRYFNFDTLEWESKEFVFLFEAVRFYKASKHEDYLRGSQRKPSLDTYYPTSWGDIPMKYYKPGETAQRGGYAGCPDHLDGGSRADYQMAGYKHF